MESLMLVALALGATAVFVGVTYAKRPDERPLGRRGLIYAVIAGLLVGLIVAILATMLFLGLYGLAEDPNKNLAEPFLAGLLVGGVLGAGYFWLNLIILAVGLWFHPTEGWAKGAAFATPVILAAIGFGYSIYKAYPL